MAATPPDVELEAANFLHKLIQGSKDEPTKLATKFYVILQHMRSIGKENSMPYQVISRAMETVINQHGLDIEALMSSRPSLASGTQVGDAPQVAGSSQRAAVEKDSKENFAADETAKIGTYSSRPLIGPSSSGHDTYQGSVSHRNGASKYIHGGNQGASGSYALVEQGIPVQMQGSRNLGKLPIQAPIATSTPFKEHHLKQLRAQCLVFLAFRNGYMPKRLHLDIALGNFFPKVDESSEDLMDQNGKEQPFDEATSSIPEMPNPFGRIVFKSFEKSC